MHVIQLCTTGNCASITLNLPHAGIQMYTGSVCQAERFQLLSGECALAVHRLCMQCCEHIQIKIGDSLSMCTCGMSCSHGRKRSMLSMNGAGQCVLDLYAALHD